MGWGPCRTDLVWAGGQAAVSLAGRAEIEIAGVAGMVCGTVAAAWGSLALA